MKQYFNLILANGEAHPTTYVVESDAAVNRLNELIGSGGHLEPAVLSDEEQRNAYKFHEKGDKLSPLVALEIADICIRLGIESPSGTDWNAPKGEDGKRIDREVWETVPELARFNLGQYDVAEDPNFPTLTQHYVWSVPVNDILARHSREWLWADKENAVRDLKGSIAPAVYDELLAMVRRRERHFFGNPEKSDQTWMIKAATAPSDPKKPGGGYKPKAGCKCRLKLAEAVAWGYEQDAYADLRYYLIPVEVSEGADMKVCAENLWQFGNALCSANGIAGYGSTYRFELAEDAKIVRLTVRSSIAD